ncbi:reverse transcriptase domain-containing protein [Citrus sinensis]|nr:reverse transcriptase domain-containing protein [Citrus sinensis]
MCMDEEICTGIGELVGKVEEVDTDKAGDCMGQIIRMRTLMPRMNKENGEEIQKEGKQLTSPWKHTQSLLNEPKNEKNQHRLDNLNPIGAEHLMKDGETLKTRKSSSQIPESTTGKEKGFGDWKIKAEKIGEKQKEGKQENVGNLQERKEKAGNVTKKETMAISEHFMWRGDGLRNHNHRGVNGGGWMPAPPATMKLISWNVRGLRKDRTFREIKRILRELKPEIVFLCETKLSEQLMKRKASELNFQNCFAISSSGKGGGLAMMWSENNRIEGVLDENGNWSIKAEEIERRFCEHFVELFTTTNPLRQQRESALKDMLKKVTVEMNKELGRPFTEEEIKEALFQMCPTKAPGPDDLPAVFFKKHWEAVKEGVTATFLHILNGKGTLAPLNHTYIALIPKIKKPRDVTEFRPISLCNVIYRIIAKSIANRLKWFLHDVISSNQSAFIPNRLITDNIIIGYKCLHKIRMSKGKKKGLVALKHAMYQLGFDRSWIELIMNCISTSSFSVLINGVPKGLIRPERGLRQGCPLSSYLFIICTEALPNLLNEAEKKQLIRGLKFNKEISINHFLFADDSLIFSRATVEESMSLKQIFECYAAASGQIFYFEKSSMFFSGSISAEKMTKVRDIFQLKIVSKHEKYLGLPSMIGRKKVSFFKDIKLRILSKISSWQSKLFSSGGNETLIKPVAQAIPAYAMSVFRLPTTLCEDIRRVIAGFWRESLIQQHFNFEDAELISRIQLLSSPKPNQILWHYDKKGNYSVNSGYQIAMRIKHPDWPSSSSSNLGQWNLIWSLELPEKIKIFMWKATRNFLPTAENLLRRKMMQEPTYLLSMLQELVKRISKDELRLIIALFWTAWHTRNIFVFENKRQDPQISVAKAEAVVESYARVRMTKVQAAAKAIPAKGAKWIPPLQGHFKANVDVAVNKEKNQVGLGVVIRDDSGAIIIAAVNHTKYHGDVAQAETAAVNFGLQVVMEAKLSPLILETDCQDVVDFVLHNKSSRTEICWTIYEIQQKMQSFNNMVELQKIQRMCNAIAHTLAKIALANRESCAWKGECPITLCLTFQSFFNES